MVALVLVLVPVPVSTVITTVAWSLFSRSVACTVRVNFECSSGSNVPVVLILICPLSGLMGEDFSYISVNDAVDNCSICSAVSICSCDCGRPFI